MKNTLKVWLAKNFWSRLPNESNAEIVCNGQIGVTDIIEDLFRAGVFTDKECALQFVAKFNEKVVEYTMSGYKVNTGLVTLKTEIRTPIINKKWNDEINSVSVSIELGQQFVTEIAETNVEILGEKDDKMGNASKYDDSTRNPEKTYINRTLLNGNDEIPACGIAFRTWLCKT